MFGTSADIVIELLVGTRAVFFKPSLFLDLWRQIAGRQCPKRGLDRFFLGTDIMRFIGLSRDLYIALLVGPNLVNSCLARFLYLSGCRICRLGQRQRFAFEHLWT